MNVKRIIDELKRYGKTQCKPRGNSMTPLIKTGDTVILTADLKSLSIGNIVFCKIRGKYYIHKIIAMNKNKGYQIGNNHGHINGWTHKVYGKLIHIK